MEKKHNVFLTIALYYVGIPILVSFVCGFASLILRKMPLALCVGVLTLLIYFLLRKEMPVEDVWKINGVGLLVYVLGFTVLMCLSKGSLQSSYVLNAFWFAAPCVPLELNMLEGITIAPFLSAFVIYFVGLVYSLLLAKQRPSGKVMVIYALCMVICFGIITPLYINRPEKRYGGHGFAYMNGYSSTDFSDYLVYKKDSKLVSLDHEPSFTIANEEDMPVMDGAEACYPLYASLAKEVYENIETIEEEFAKENSDEYRRFNGKIVTFTNTVVGFRRLIREWYSDKVDIFFGAYPSKEQLALAKEYGEELEMTKIGQEAFVFFVEEDNPITNLTSEQIKAIYHGDITNWKEVGGKDEEIIAFQRPSNSGSQTMMEYFMGDVTLAEPKTYEIIDSMVGVIDEVAQYANEDGALGYSFRYFIEGLNQEKNVRLLSIDGVAPTLESIEDGSYPLTVGLYVITHKDDANPNVKKLVEYILSDEGQEFVHKSGYGRLNK